MSRPRRFLVAPALALLLLAAGCGKSASGDGYQLSADQLTPKTTTSVPPTTVAEAPSTPPKPFVETDVATAKVPEVEVFANKPGNPAVASTLPPTSKPGLPAIPRDGLNSAGSRKTPNGWAFSNPTYFKNPLVFVVLADEGDWLKVMVPARPNGMQGYVKASDVTITRIDYRMELDLSKPELTVYKGSDMIVQTPVVIGKQSSKTPVGQFYLNEKVTPDNPNGPYGPMILSTSGYSEDLNEFDGGLPVIAFHGTNQPQLLGQSVSNGCIRMPNDVDTKLSNELPQGTPIRITAAA